MKTAIIIVVAIIVVVVLLAAVVAVIGSQLPTHHLASRSVLLHRSPQEVYGVIRDFESAHTWRSGLKRIEVEQQSNGGIHFREESSQGTVNYDLEEDQPGERMVTRILDKDLGYSGKWIYTLSPENGGTRLTIMEDGEVSNVIFRFMSRYVFGHTATIDGYLKSLGKHFGEEAQPQ